MGLQRGGSRDCHCSGHFDEAIELVCLPWERVGKALCLGFVSGMSHSVCLNCRLSNNSRECISGGGVGAALTGTSVPETPTIMDIGAILLTS